MQHYEHLATYERKGFEVIVDKTWEEMDVGHGFDDECYDVRKMREQINNGDLDWFMLRVRVMFEGHEFGSAYLGGCLYEDAREVLTDGTAEDFIEEAMAEAKREVHRLAGKLWAQQMEMDYADAQPVE